MRAEPVQHMFASDLGGWHPAIHYSVHVSMLSRQRAQLFLSPPNHKFVVSILSMSTMLIYC
jgi:hypothetical protein